MERIKQAVEKARKNREAMQDFNIPEPARNNIFVEPVRIADDIQDLSQIKYAHTKVVAVDEKVLIENRIISNILEQSDANGAYKLLRTRVLQKMKASQWSTIGITSPGSGEGKTLTAVNLAISLAAEGNHTVLLVDFDLKYPNVARQFGYQPDNDLSNVLFDNIPLSEIMFNPGIERLVVLPGGRPIPNSSETLLSAKIERLLNDLKSRYKSRIIIFDLPPLLATDDVLAFSPLLDTCLLVVEDGKTHKDEILKSMEMLSSIDLMGVVLNKSSEKLSAY